MVLDADIKHEMYPQIVGWCLCGEKAAFHSKGLLLAIRVKPHHPKHLVYLPELWMHVFLKIVRPAPVPPMQSLFKRDVAVVG